MMHLEVIMWKTHASDYELPKFSDSAKLEYFKFYVFELHLIHRNSK